MLADDVRVPHRLQELRRAVEIVDADHHAAQALSNVPVRAGAGDDPVLGGEALRLLVERGERDARVEHLQDVDLLDDVEQVLVVGHGVQAVERMRHVDQAALTADLGDRLRHRHPPLDLLLDEEADHLALLGGLHLLGDDHLDPDLVRDLTRLERAGDLVVVGDRDRPQPLLLRRLEQRPTGVAQSGEWSVCIWRSTPICSRRAIRLRTAESPAGSWRRAASRA